MINIYKKPCKELELSKKDIGIYLGYYGIKLDSSTDLLIEDCIREFCENVVFRACYTVLPIECTDGVSLENLKFCSKSLKKNLDGCESAYIFAASLFIPGLSFAPAFLRRRRNELHRRRNKRGVFKALLRLLGGYLRSLLPEGCNRISR